LELCVSSGLFFGEMPCMGWNSSDKLVKEIFACLFLLLKIKNHYYMANKIEKQKGILLRPRNLGIVAVTALLCILTSCGNDERGSTSTTMKNPTETANNAVENTNSTADSKGTTSGLGAFVKQKMACGVELNIPENGSEARLMAFIEDTGKPADKTIWFTMDRLSFKTGNSTSLDMAKSFEQLQNIVEILKCYPKVQLKIGAYADNSGDKNAMKKQSSDRATIVKATLIGMGVAPGRLEAEGFGDQNPVASNDTKESHPQNSRINLQVKAK